MSLEIQAKTLKLLPRQTIEVALFTKLLGVSLDNRNNTCLLWLLGDTTKDAITDKIEIVMLRLGGELTPASAKYVGNFKDNSGVWHVFSHGADVPPKPISTADKQTVVTEFTPEPVNA